MTTLLAWVGADQRGPASLRIASDSRISWSANGTVLRKWDFGRKVFASRNEADVIGYCGDSFFPTQTLSQIIDLIDRGVFFPIGASAEEKVELIVTALQLAADGYPAAEKRALAPPFYGYDGGGNVRFLTNLAGTVTDTNDYDALGNLFHFTGTTPNVFLYRGEQYDSDLGLYYLRARYYNPATGRFMGRDLEDGITTDPKTLHKYFYAGGDPINLLDPSGRAEIAETALVDWHQVSKEVAAVFQTHIERMPNPLFDEVPAKLNNGLSKLP